MFPRRAISMILLLWLFSSTSTQQWLKKQMKNLNQKIDKLNKNVKLVMEECGKI